MKQLLFILFFLFSVDNISAQHNPYGWSSLRFNDIVYSMKGETDSTYFDNDTYCHKKRPLTVLFTGYNASTTKEVEHIFVIFDNDKTPNINQDYLYPPEVKELIYHDLGDKDEYCGVWLEYPLIDDQGNPKDQVFQEFPLDRAAAQMIIYLLADHTEWKNKTSIPFSQTNFRLLRSKKIKRNAYSSWSIEDVFR